MRRGEKLSLLLLDDNPELVRLYKQQLEKYGDFRITTEIDGGRAKLLAEKQLFDLIIIDAKLEYRGIEFGGIRLADDLRPRYGTNSLLIISRFITAELLREHGIFYEFIEKSSGVRSNHFYSDLCRRIRIMRKRQYVFVAMPFAKRYSTVYSRYIKTAVRRAGYNCVRVDEVTHNRPIQEVIFELVEKSKLVVFLADGENPNAYYEAGFADAMGKEVVIVADSLATLKFDVANRHSITYGGNLQKLSTRLESKLRALRLHDPITL